MSTENHVGPNGPTELDPNALGIAGAMTRGFITSPITPLLLVGFLFLGLFGLIATPRQEDPQISVPMVDIFVSFPGASAEQVSNQVAVPLEQLMTEIKGVEHVYSASMRDQALVTVQFVVGEQMEPSLVKLYDKLSSNMDRIPPGVSQPLVKPKGVDDVPMVTLTLWSEEVDDATLRLVALDVLKHIKSVENTSQSFLVSGREEQMTVSIFPEKLSGFGITLDQIAQTIQAANTEQNAGNIEAGGQFATVYTGSFLRSEDELRRLIVGLRDGRAVYLGDVAEVRRGPGPVKRMVSYYTGAAYDGDLEAHGAPAVTIAIAKKHGSNGVSVASDVLAMVETLKGRIIPDNVQVSITRNYGETARDKVNELIFKLFVATSAVVFLVWFFLGWRAATVVLVVIPIVILFTVFSALVVGFTIDRVSLFALIFSIGILVDDAIVVVENVYRRWLEKGGIDIATTIDAVAEVGNPTILATFTVVAALLPMAAVRGMMGPYMMPIPVLGSVAMVFSLFAAFVFTPWLALKLRPTIENLQRAEDKEHHQIELLGRFYSAMLKPLIKNRTLGWMFLASLFIVFFACLSLFYFKAVKVKMLPLDNKPEFNIVVNFPEGTALPETANLIGQIAEVVRSIDEVTAVQTYVGTASPFNFNGLVRHYYLRRDSWQGDVQVQLTHKKDRKRSSHQIAVEVREMIKPMAQRAGARVQVVEMPPGPPVLQSVVAEVYGPDAETRRQVANDLREMFEQAPHLDDVDDLMPAPYEVWRFEVDREKSQRVGVSVADVNRTLNMAMGDFQAGDIKYNSVLDITRIIIEAPVAIRSDFGRLLQLPVPSQMGTTVPLSELGRFVKGLQDPVIYHKDLRPVEFVTAETVGTLAAPIYGMLEVEDLLKKYTAPDGVEISGTMMGPPETSYQSGFEWAGEWTVTYETFRDMGIAFGVALILIYMLVVWEFGNFTLPAIVMAPIPLTLVGIIPGHWLLNAEFTATSMIGFIALAGIIVRNSILLVDFTKHKVEQGMDVLDAIIMSCQVRTRPIVITAFALVGGSSVILFDPIFQGMAVSLLFGVLVSTALTLFIIPLGCYSAREAFVCRVDDENGGLGPSGGGSSGGGGGIGGRIAGALGTVFSVVGLYLMLIVKGLAKGILMLLMKGIGFLIEKIQGKRNGDIKVAPARATVNVATPAAPIVAGAETLSMGTVATQSNPSDDPRAETPVSYKRVEAPVSEHLTDTADVAAAAQAAAEQAAAEKAAAEKAAAEKAAAEKAAAEKAAAEKAAAEKAAAEQAAAEKAAAEKAAAEKAAAEKAAAEKAAAEKAAAEKATAE
ncbi:MAG: efflux RND transporter permease subunit, partial [Thiotrichales bacterium]